jgi:hypothetical protein
VNGRLLIALIAVFLAVTPLVAGYTTKDAWFPVVGHAVGYGGRGFYTTIYLTNTSNAAGEVTLSFYAAAQPNVAPRTQTLPLGSHQTAAVDVGAGLTGDAGATGALHILSSGPFVATARLYSRGVNQPAGTEVGAAVSAIPAQYAIGTGESTILHVPAGARYKIYAAETHGFPLYFSVMTMPDSAERRLYLSANEQRSWDLEELFHGTSATSLQLTGVSGSGKIIITGTSIAQASQDFTTWEMSLPSEPRHSLHWPELTAYAAVALALASSAIYKMKR